MASRTIIDELIVTLGLDPKNFEKGKKKAAADLVDLKNQARNTGDEMDKAGKKAGDSFVAFGKRVAVVALLFKGLSMATRFILEASRATRQLGNDARSADVSARMLRNFQNVAEMMGGAAEDATKTIEGMQRAVFNMRFNGEMSQQLVQLGRLGVRFQDQDGGVRDFKEIYLDAAKAVQANIASGTMNEADALAFLESAGFDRSLARAAVYDGFSGALEAIDKQEGRRQVSAEDVAATTAAEQAMTSAGQAKDALGVKMAVAAAPNIQRIAEGAEGLFNAGEMGDVAVAWESWKKAIEPLTIAINDAAFATKEWAASIPKRIGSSVRDMGRGRAARNNNPGNMMAVGNQKRDPDGFAIFDSLEEGVMHASLQLDRYAARGNNTIAGILGKWNPADAPGNSPANLAAYIASVAKQTGIDPNKQLTAADRAQVLAAMFEHEDNRNTLDSSQVADIMMMPDKNGRTLLEHAEASIESRSGGHTTNVQIDEVNVATQSKDPEGMAEAADDALQRKLMAGQAEQGMQ
jgi:hypothetical protein